MFSHYVLIVLLSMASYNFSTLISMIKILKSDIVCKTIG